MRDHSLPTEEHRSHPFRLSATEEEDRGSTAVPPSQPSPPTSGAKKTAGDDVLALVSTKPGNASPKNDDIESGAEHKEEPDNLSPRNASHAEGTLIENPPQDEVHYATMSWWHTALGKPSHPTPSPSPTNQTPPSHDSRNRKPRHPLPPQRTSNPRLRTRDPSNPNPGPVILVHGDHHLPAQNATLRLHPLVRGYLRPLAGQTGTVVWGGGDESHAGVYRRGAYCDF